MEFFDFGFAGENPCSGAGLRVGTANGGTPNRCEQSNRQAGLKHLVLLV